MVHLLPSTPTYTIIPGQELTLVCYKGGTFLVLSCPSDVPFVSQAELLKKKIELENGEKSSSISSFAILPMKSSVLKGKLAGFWGGAGLGLNNMPQIACLLFFFFCLCVNDLCLCNFDHSFLPHLKFKC
jgi:hypothetical protein